MLSRTLRLPAETTEAELLALIDELNAEDAVDGILVQLPLPRRSTEQRVLDRSIPKRTSTASTRSTSAASGSTRRGFDPVHARRHRRAARSATASPSPAAAR